MSLIQVARPQIVRRDEQSHPAAARDAPQSLEHGLESGTAEAAALLPAVQREPAEPPARGIAQFGVHDEEAGEHALCLDRHDGVGRAATHGSQDFGDGAEETIGLLGVELDGCENAQLGAFQPAVVQGREAPSG